MNQCPEFNCAKCGALLMGIWNGRGWEPTGCAKCPCAGVTTAAQRERQLRKEARDALDVDIPALVAQMKALPVFRDCPRSIAKTKVVIVYAALRGGGYAHGNRMVRIRVTRCTPLYWLLETILHELCHAALPRGTNHSEWFRRVLARGAREMWGIDVDPNPKNENGRVGRYALDAIIEQALADKLFAGMPYPKKAPEPVVDRAAARDRLIEKRAAHAAAMLARAERKLKLARTIAAKWRKKVTRYEKIAARKGEHNV